MKKRKVLVSILCAAALLGVSTTALTGCKKNKDPEPTPEVQKFTVTFNSKGGSSVNKLDNIESGSKITAPTAPTRTNYDFAGWYKDEGYNNPWKFDTDTVTASITLYAKWTPKGDTPVVEKFTVTFNSDGGSEVTALTEVAKGSKISKPTDPTKEGHTFDYWVKEDGSAWNFDTDTVTANITLKAVWVEDGGDTPVEKYTVTFNSDGGSTVEALTNVASGSKISKPADPTKEGHTFDKWVKEDGSAWNFDADKVTSNITLKATWIKNDIPQPVEKYTVTFNSDGGSAVAALTEVEKGSKINKPADPTKEGHTFDKWVKEDGSAWNFDTDTVTSNITLKATWTKNDTPQPVEKYTVTFDSAGGSAVTAISNVESGDTITKPTDPTKAGHRFVEWIKADGTAWNFAEDTVTSNITLIATWEELSLYQTLLDKGGVIINDDFNSYTASDVLPDYSGTPGTKGLYQYLNKKSGTGDKTLNYVAFDGDTAHLVDTSADGTQMIIDFGKSLNNGVVEGAFDLTLVASSESNGWTFLQLYGSDAAKTNGEVFGFRSQRKTSSSKDPMFIQYRLDGGSALLPATTLKDGVTPNEALTTQDSTYHIYFLLDIEKNQFTVRISNDAGETCYILEESSAGITDISYIKLVSSDGNKSTMKIDNLVIRQDEIETSKYIAKMQNELQAVVDKMALDTNYTANKQIILDLLEKGKQKISEQENNDNVYNAYNEALTAIKAVPNDTAQLVVNARNDANEALNQYYNEHVESYTYENTLAAYDEALEAGRNLILEAKNVEEVATKLAAAKALLDACETDARYLERLKAEEIAKLEVAYPADNYTHRDNIEVYNGVMNGIIEEINKAETPDAISIIVGLAIENLNEVETNAQVLRRYKDDYLKQLSEHRVEEIAALEVDHADIFAQITEAKATYAETIENATITATARETYDDAIKAIDALIALATEDLESIQQKAKTDLAALITTDSVNSIIDNAILSTNNYVKTVEEGYWKEGYPLLAKDTYATLDVSTALASLVAEANTAIDAATEASAILGADTGIVAVYTAKIRTAVEQAMLEISKPLELEAFETYALEKKDGIKNTSAQTRIQNRINEKKTTVNNPDIVNSLNSLMFRISRGYHAADQIVIELETGTNQNDGSPIYRLTVTFANTTLEPQTDIIYDQYAVYPADPTSADGSFAGWYADAELTQPFDFENTPIWNDTTVYAKWYDATFEEIKGTKVTEKFTTKPNLNGANDSSTETKYGNDTEYILVKDSNNVGANKIGSGDQSSAKTSPIKFAAGDGIMIDSTGAASILLHFSKDVSLTLVHYKNSDGRNFFISEKQSKTADEKAGEILHSFTEPSAKKYAETETVKIPAGDWYLNATAKLYILEISYQTIENKATVYTGFEGTLSNTSYQSTASVKPSLDLTGLNLTTKEGNPIAITNDMVTSGQIKVEFTQGTAEGFGNGSQGTYKFRLKYGKYTVSEEYTVTMEVLEA